MVITEGKDPGTILKLHLTQEVFQADTSFTYPQQWWKPHLLLRERSWARCGVQEGLQRPHETDKDEADKDDLVD